MKTRKNASPERIKRKYAQAVEKEIDGQTRDVERPGEDTMDQFIIQEEMKKSSFAPKSKRDNPL